MERPDRVIIDLPEVAFHLPAETGRKREGLIASYRYGLFAPGRSRVVMDLAQPAIVSRHRVQPDAPGGAAILVVELSRAERDEFRARRRGKRRRASRRLRRSGRSPKDASDARPVIVIDPGHGGIDPGAAAAGGVIEKESSSPSPSSSRRSSKGRAATGS